MRQFIPLLVVMACSPDTQDPGGQFGEENGNGCEIVEEVALTLDEVSELGFTAQDLVDLVEGEHTETLTWADDTTTGLTVTVSDASNPRLIRWAHEDDGSGAEIDLDGLCEDTVGIDVTLAFATDDGAFAESWSRTIESSNGTEAVHYVRLETLSGSFDTWDWADDAYEEVWADLDITFSDGAIAGTIDGGGQQTHGDPDDPDSAVSATWFPIATFGDVDPPE